MLETIGQCLSCVQRQMYFALPRNSSLPSGGRVRVVPYDPSHEDALSLIASVARGSIYVTAEQLTTDPELTEVDELYSAVGLRRTCHVWLAYREYKDEPIGAVIAYRVPLGLNFTYIQNPSPLLLHPTLPALDHLHFL